jgi:hypothetical protein
MRLVFALGAAIALSGSAWAQDVQVPFVGCKSDGQVGALDPPKDGGTAPKLAAAVASRLAWYASNNTGGVLAPRGWQCFELYGSNGSVLMVQPGDFGRALLSTELSGPAIQLSISLGDTSGRFEAAQLAARLFPDRRGFVDKVISEGLEPKAEFVFGPFPQDRIHRLSRDVVAFETPANTDGMGTKSRLLKSGDPIQGLVWMDRDNNATFLAVRLAPSQRDLAAYIINEMKPRKR